VLWTLANNFLGCDVKPGKTDLMRVSYWLVCMQSLLATHTLSMVIHKGLHMRSS